MYISYINKETQQIETLKTDIITTKNRKELEKRMHYFEYLYNEAVHILGSGDISKRYKTEYRLKKNKTKRRIDVPDDELMEYQNQVVDIFSNCLELIFPKSVFGYVKGRSAKQMAQVHKDKYQVIKLDIKNFFPSCTLEFIMKSMSRVYPFCLVDREVIETIIMPCLVYYNRKHRLPQGAPTSPILSNIAMIPIDYTLESGMLTALDYDYTYTRFADDIVLSHGKFCFRSQIKLEDLCLSKIFGTEYKEKEISPKEEYYKIGKIVNQVIAAVQHCLKRGNPDFYINSQKTKVLNTNCGNVWMLGVTVGSDVKIGNEKKQRLKASLWSFLNDCKNGNPWTEKETRQMLGVLGYAKYVEPNFAHELIEKYQQKTGMNLKKEVEKILCL